MGAIASSIGELSPLTAVSNAVKAAVHDISVFILNDCSSECNCCDCLVCFFRSKETHDDNIDIIRK